jgi:hypothetical protein
MRVIVGAGIIAITIVISTLAQASDVDWKYYGGIAQGADLRFCFYDAKGVTHAPDGHLRVWIKCLSKKDMKAVNVEKDFDGKIMKSVAKRVANYYMPPILKAQDINFDEMLNIVTIEEIADIAYIQPKVSIFYELNCSERKLRELSYSIGTFSRDKPTEWQFIPPEGNAANLLKILCPL